MKLLLWLYIKVFLRKEIVYDKLYLFCRDFTEKALGYIITQKNIVISTSDIQNISWAKNAKAG